MLNTVVMGMNIEMVRQTSVLLAGVIEASGHADVDAIVEPYRHTLIEASTALRKIQELMREKAGEIEHGGAENA